MTYFNTIVMLFTCCLQERPFSSSPFIASCDDKYIQVTQLLISNGADVDYQDNVQLE